MTSLDIYNQQRAREQFQEKMASLNKGFIKALEDWVAKCPHYDLTPSIKSYLKHVEDLDSTYCNEDEKGEKLGKTPINRKIAKARRRMKGSPDLNTSKDITIAAASSTPFSTNVPRFRLSDVSTIAPNESMIVTPEVTSRKRAIRGGGPLGEPESVVFRGDNAASNPAMTTEASKLISSVPALPKASPDFWGFGKKDSNGSSSTGTTTIDGSPSSQKTDLIKRISFSKEKTPEKEKTMASDSKEPIASSIFNKPPFGTNSIFAKAAEAKDDSTSKPIFPNFLKKDESSPKPAFPNFMQTLGTPSFSFGTKESPKLGFGSTETKDSTKSIFGTSLTGEIPKINFGPTGTTGTTALVAPKLTFGPPVTNNSQGETQEEGEEGEYVPPKAEVIEGAEPDAFMSVKCVVHKMVDKQYEKLGVGMLHLKEKDGKKSFLLRAATTVATIWINALINKTMKVTKVEDLKLRIMCPTGDKEIAIHLLRFPSAKDADRVREAIEKGSA